MFTLRSRVRGRRGDRRGDRRQSGIQLSCNLLEERAVPATLLHSLYPDPTGPQPGAQFGTSVAADSSYRVVGAPNSDLVSLTNVGQAFVYDASTNKIVATLNNPSPANDDRFGASVAVSGKYVIVGAYQDDVGATESGSVYVFDMSSKNPTIPFATLLNPTPAKTDNFGISVAISGNTVIVGASNDDTGATDAGLVYAFDLGSEFPELPLVTLSNPTPAVGEQFGYAVGVFGNHIIIGSYLDDTGATDAGVAHVYDVSSMTPTVPVLSIPNPSPNAMDYFGKSVAISGSSIVIGASADDAGAFDAGSVYVYNLASPTPQVPTVTLNNPTPFTSDQFGLSVAISGKFAVIGASQDDTGASNAGAAYIYDLTSALPTTPYATLQNPNPEPEDKFGNAVSILGDFVLVGAYLDGTVVADIGSVFVYDFSASPPVPPQASLTNATPAIGDSFGIEVATSGNLLVVGAHTDDTEVLDAGSVYVYDLDSINPTSPIAILHNPAPATFDFFGGSVAVDGKIIVVGALLDDEGAIDAGSAYVYDLDSADPLIPIAVLNNPTPANSDYFGTSVAVLGDLVFVAAWLDDTSAFNAGFVYVYDLKSATPTMPIGSLVNPAPSAGDSFGFSMAASGNYVVVGAYQDNIGAPDTGSAYVFDLTSASPYTAMTTLNNPAPGNGDRFGVDVDISGQLVVVGAYNDDTGATDAGSAYVFNLSSISPTVPIATLNNPSPAVNDWFGVAVAVSGKKIVIGVDHDDTGAMDAGSVYVYDLDVVAPGTPIITLNNPMPAGSDNFGRSVGTIGTSFVVGAFSDDDQNTDQGSARIYSLLPTVISIQPNSGSPQRSTVTSLTVNFDIPVSFAGNPSAAFTLVNQSTMNPVNLAATVDPSGRSVTLTFTGGSVDGASLADGRYTLTINANQFAGDGFDGNSDGVAGDDYVLVGNTANGLFRLFGDSDGNGAVTAADFSAFRIAYGSAGSIFDFNNDGQTGAADFEQFRLRYGVVV